MANIGYVRVSSIQQITDRQLEGVAVEKTFTDKASGKNTDRPQLKAMLDYVREGDTIHADIAPQRKDDPGPGTFYR